MSAGMSVRAYVQDMPVFQGFRGHHDSAPVTAMKGAEGGQRAPAGAGTFDRLGQIVGVVAQQRHGRVGQGRDHDPALLTGGAGLPFFVHDLHQAQFRVHVVALALRAAQGDDADLVQPVVLMDRDAEGSFDPPPYFGRQLLGNGLEAAQEIHGRPILETEGQVFHVGGLHEQVIGPLPFHPSTWLSRELVLLSPEKGPVLKYLPVVGQNR